MRWQEGTTWRPPRKSTVLPTERPPQMARVHRLPKTKARAHPPVRPLKRIVPDPPHLLAFVPDSSMPPIKRPRSPRNAMVRLSRLSGSRPGAQAAEGGHEPEREGGMSRTARCNRWRWPRGIPLGTELLSHFGRR
jgi:hypothetical protein